MIKSINVCYVVFLSENDIAFWRMMTSMAFVILRHSSLKNKNYFITHPHVVSNP